MIQFSIYEQTCHGRIQWRVMRDDGLLVFGNHHQVDFTNEEDAVQCLLGDIRRNKLGHSEINVHYITRPLSPRQILFIPKEYPKHDVKSIKAH